MRAITSAIATMALLAAGTPVLAGPCADEIKALQEKAAKSDAATKPGNQQTTSSPGTQPQEGGGGVSASAKILEAQAHDGRKDEANCMKAVEEAKQTIK